MMMQQCGLLTGVWRSCTLWYYIYLGESHRRWV